MKYIDSIDKNLRNYFKLIEPNYPVWLNEYIDTPELLHQREISVTCGGYYTNMFNMNYFYSSLDHSVAVALIIWHFTHDKKQTLSGLFHDIATPAFKHTVDFLNNDYMTQESTEDLTTKIIKSSNQIVGLLNRDGIKIEEVDNYHLYSIADNDIPKLSADRLEYSLSNALFVYNTNNFDKIKEIYEDINIQLDEQGNAELGFKTKKIARDFVKMTSELSVIYRGKRYRYSMQLIADILKRLNYQGKIVKEDLYKLNDMEVINIIEASNYGNVFKKWRNATDVNESKTKPVGVYYVNHGAKVRWIDPLFNGKRLSSCCKLAKRYIDKNLTYDMDKYLYLDFDLD